MTELQQFHFLRPLWLLALIPTLITWWKLYQGSDPRLGLSDDIAPHLLDKLVSVPAERPRIRPETMFLPLGLIMVLALAGPSFRKDPSPFAEDKSQLLLLVKLGPSMLTEDLQPSRLERARTKIHDLLDVRKGSDTGLIAYSGSAHLVMPATSDSSIIDHMLEALEPSVMPSEGDSLTEALELASQQLIDKGVPGSILVVTDSVEARQISTLEQWRQENPVITQFMVPLRDPEALERSGVIPAAKVLNAKTHLVTADERDIRLIANRAERSIVGFSNDESIRWRDDGYLFVPLLALGVLFWCRRGWAIQE